MSQTQESSLKKASTHLGRILLILTIIGATAFWISYFYAPIEIKEGNYSIQAAEYPEIDTIELEYLADYATVDIRYDAPESILFNASWIYVYSPRENVPLIDLNISAVQSPSPNVLHISINDTIDNFPMFDSSRNIGFFFVEIHLNPKYLAILDIQSETASFSIIAQDISFSTFDISVSTGSISVLFNNVTIPSQMSINSTTGNVNLMISYSTLNDVYIGQTTGSLYGTIQQGIMGSLTFTGTTGSIDLTLENLSTSSISLDRTTGSINFDMILVDIEDLNNASVAVFTTTGSIDINIEDLLSNNSIELTAEASTGSIDLSWIAHDILVDNMYINLSTSTGSIDAEIETYASNFDKFIVNTTTVTGNSDVDFNEI